MVDQTQDKVPKKRRRWLVTLVALLASLVLWWYWPRGDARFVGKWALTEYASRTTSGTLTMNANGVAIWTVASGNRVLGSWRVENQDLIVGMCKPSEDGPVRHWMNDGLFWAATARIANFDGHWKVSRIDDKSFDAKMNGPLTSRKSGGIL